MRADVSIALQVLNLLLILLLVQYIVRIAGTFLCGLVFIFH